MEKCLVHCPGSHKDGLHPQGTQLSQHRACSAVSFHTGISGLEQGLWAQRAWSSLWQEREGSSLVCALAFRRKTYPACPTIFWKSLKNFPLWSQSSQAKLPHLFPRWGGSIAVGGQEHIQVVPLGHGGLKALAVNVCQIPLSL